MALLTKKPFTEWLLILAKLYFLPIGRIGRIEFSIAFSTVFILGFIAVIFLNNPNNQFIMINLIICMWILVVNAIKRLKDLNSKLWYAIFVIIPVLNLFVLLGLMLSEGTPGINPYGPRKKPLSL